MTTWFRRCGVECSQPVTPTSDVRGLTTDKVMCSRCGGAGGSQAWAHTGWTCYECGGHGTLGYKEVPVYTAEKLKALQDAQAVRDEARAEKARQTIERKEKAARAREAAFLTTHKDLIDEATRYASKDGFLADVLESVTGKWSMSERQEEVIRQCIEKAKQREAEEANAESCPTGRLEITGTVISMKTRISQYGETLKMLVKDDRGFKVWGTVPRGMYDSEVNWTVDTCRGLRVTFTATIEPSSDDRLFGFYSRPAKASILEDK